MPQGVHGNETEEQRKERLARVARSRWEKTNARLDFNKTMKKVWTEEKRRAHSARMKEISNRDEMRAKRSEAVKARWTKPGAHERASQAQKARHADPAYRVKFKAAMNDPVTKAKLRATTQRQFAAMTPEQRRAHTARARRVVKGGKYVSSIEAKVIQALNDLHIPYLVHVSLSNYTVDVFIPSRKLIIECDGDQWHQSGPDDERDRILREHGRVVHLPGSAIDDDAVAAVRGALDDVEVSEQ